MTTIRDFITGFMGSNPYEGFDPKPWAKDISGWGSTHAWFNDIIAQFRPRSILELGTWKGASAINMAQHARRLVPDAQVLCVDTWLGSHKVLWSNPDFRRQLLLRNGYPQQYFQFLANVVHSGLQEAIFPLPMTAYAATGVLAEAGMKFDVIYIDAHHDEDEVASDIRRSWPLLRQGGMMFGDDYLVTEPGVISAVNRFVADNRLYLHTAGEKWGIQKP